MSERDTARIETIAGNLDPNALAAARQVFLRAGPSLTIRQGRVTGEANFHRRLAMAIAAYQDCRQGGAA